MQLVDDYSWNHLILDGGLLALYFILIIVAKYLNNFLSPYCIDTELTQKDNSALSVSLCGYFIAITSIFVGSMLGPAYDELTLDVIKNDLMQTALYVFIGILLLNVARLVNDKIILYQFSNVKEIIEDRNVGTGAVQFGSYVASGLIIAGSIHGEGGGILTTVAFFVCGQLALIMFTFIYNLITPFNIHDEIEKDNVAAGIAFGGTLIAQGIILMKAVSGDFYSWQYNLSKFGISTIMICIFLPTIRFLFDKLMIRNSSLNHEISHDKNNGAAFLEASIAISVATILCFISI
jgi:uncharacterized membrane protein YjfL (UPF0719 family)